MKLPAAMRIKYDQFMAEGSLIVLEGAVLNMMDVYEDLDNHIQECGYDVRCLGFDPYNAKEFVARWESENGPFGIEKVIQGAKTESVPLGELKKLSEERMLSYLGWIDCTDTYLTYRKWIKPYVSFQQLKRKVSRYDKYDEKRVYQKLVSLYTAKGGKSHGVKLQICREHSPTDCT